MYIRYITLKQKAMKIQVKDLKVGMLVKQDNQWIRITKLIEGVQKNGKKFYNIEGMVQPATIRRRGGFNRNTEIKEEFFTNYPTPKFETWVTVK